MAQRVAVIMAGGSGTRFWPVSTPQRPKQFLNLADPAHSLLEEALQRAAALAGIENVVIQTVPALVEATRAHCPHLNPAQTDAEPDKRNTIGAVVWAAGRARARYPETWRDVEMAFLTADHHIEPLETFLATCNELLAACAAHNAIGVIGITPDRPETGFGYIEMGDSATGPVHHVSQFHEKPDRERAIAYLESGRYLWNSGMFFWTLGALADAFAERNPAVHTAFEALSAALIAGDDAQAVAAFQTLKSEPVDIALAEIAPRRLIIPSQFHWDDLGAWDAVHRSIPHDAQANAIKGNARLLESTGNVIFNDHPTLRVNAYGLEDCVIVVSGDELLICPKSEVQNVKKFSE